MTIRATGLSTIHCSRRIPFTPGLLQLFLSRAREPGRRHCRRFRARLEDAPSENPLLQLRQVAPRVGQEIAHLTYGRLAYKSEEERRWPNWDITDEIVTALNVWLALAPDYVGPQVNESLKDYYGRWKVRAE